MSDVLDEEVEGIYFLHSKFPEHIPRTTQCLSFQMLPINDPH